MNYEELLEKARETYESEDTPHVVKAWLLANIIYPTDKSEDEKNIKDLIDELKCSLIAANCQNDACGGGHEKRIALLKWGIAWLEKQGEIDLEHYKDGENEKRKFVGYGFLKCKGDFLSFKEGETYWLEYVGKDNYNVRSDNLLGQTFHIKPVELYTVFRPTTWLEKQGKKSTIIDISKMVMEYSQTKDGDFGLPVNCMIRAYRKGINDALKLSLNLEKQGKKLDPDEVIKWLDDQACQGWIEDVEVEKFVDKFKKDFGL